jgi:hypothetical protein
MNTLLAQVLRQRRDISGEDNEPVDVALEMVAVPDK